jgi:hypothetical protein
MSLEASRMWSKKMMIIYRTYIFCGAFRFKAIAHFRLEVTL